MAYVSCQHAMPHFEIFNERNEVVLSGFFTTEQEALAFLMEGNNAEMTIEGLSATMFHIGHACMDHDEWQHGSCKMHQAKLMEPYDNA
jgi:hypothetical protein